MSNTVALSLLGIGTVVIAALAYYAVSLRRQVARREAFRRDEDRRARDNALENLELVASALVQGQVEVTEGCWRIKVLLEVLDPSLLARSEFRVFAEVHEETRHLHTHDARKELTARQRFAEDRHRLSVEDRLRGEVLEAAKFVLDFRARYPESLT